MRLAITARNFVFLKFIWHSDLRRRAASRLVLPCTSSYKCFWRHNCPELILEVRPPSAASPSAKSIQEDEIPLAVMAGRMKKFSEYTSIIPEVMDSSTLNLNPNFKFSRFLGGGASQLGYALGSLGQSLTRVKISWRSTP